MSYTCSTPSKSTLSIAIAATLAMSTSMMSQVRAFPPEIPLSTLDGSNGFKVDGEMDLDRSGTSVSAAGDVNGDGLDDLIIGAPFADFGGSYAGRSYVVCGQTSFPSTLSLSTLNGINGFKLDGETPASVSGNSVASVGDVNGDGLTDLVVGAYGGTPNGIYSGRSYVVFGQKSFPSTLQLSALDGVNGFKLDGEAPYDFSGRSVAAAGDVNGDGLSDLIVGASGADAGGNMNAGRTYVVLGSEGGFPSAFDLSTLDGSNGFALNGVAAYDISGFSVAGGGDFNGDGLSDLIIGAYGADPNGDRSGSSYVVFGRSSFPPTLQLSALDGTNGFKLEGEIAFDFSGRSVAATGDFNGDGLSDLLVGALLADPNGFSSGRTYVVFGSNSFPSTVSLSALDGSNGFKLDGEAAYDRAGDSVSSAGDINGDGLDDLIIGAAFSDTNGPDSGRSYVVFGRTSFPSTLELSSLNGSNGFALNGEAEADFSGSSVSAAGDINGDGIDDLIIGAKGASPNGIESGRSYIVFGRANDTPAMSLSPDPLSFGDVAMGSTTIEELTLENTGTGTLEPGELLINGPQAGGFDIKVNECIGEQLGPSEFCAIDIGFTPSQTGISLATLEVQSNALDAPNRVQLRGSSGVVFADGFESP